MTVKYRRMNHLQRQAASVRRQRVNSAVESVPQPRQVDRCSFTQAAQ